MFRRFLSLALAAFMLLPMLVACGKGETSVPPGPAADTSAAEDVYQLPQYDFEEHEFNILQAGRSTVNHNDFIYDEVNPSVLDSAIERRNKAVESLYNIKIVTRQQNTTANQQSPEAYRVLVREATSGDYNYDMCVIPGYDVSQLAYEGYLTDLNILPYFDAENPWYDKKANETFTFGKTLFFTTGDFGVDMMDQTCCIAFNKDLAAQYGVENLYDLVNDYEWTIDKMAAIAKEVTTDSDGDGVTDVYGNLYWVDSIYCALNAAGDRLVTLDRDTWTYEITCDNERVYNMLERFYNLVQDPKTSIKYLHVSAQKEYIPIFSGNKALFFQTTIGKLGEFRDMETDYGILPYFLYDEQQTEYHNTVAPYYMNYMCVPLMVEDDARTSAIIEAIGYYSQEYVIPAYYDKTLTGQYTRDEDSAEMLDIIFATRAYDLGYCYQPANLNKHLIYMLNEGNFDWSSRYARLEMAANIILGVISDSYQKTAGIIEE